MWWGWWVGHYPTCLEWFVSLASRASGGVVWGPTRKATRESHQVSCLGQLCVDLHGACAWSAWPGTAAHSREWEIAWCANSPGPVQRTLCGRGHQVWGVELITVLHLVRARLLAPNHLCYRGTQPVQSKSCHFPVNRHSVTDHSAQGPLLTSDAED